MPENNPPNNLPIEEAPLQKFFKREEIKTMTRDIAGLREMEAKTEKERIVSLKPIETKPQPPSVPFSTSLPIPPSPSVISPTPATSSSPHKKIIIRGIITLISLFLLGFGFWLWQGKKPAVQKQPVKTETPAPQPELSLPPSLISVQDTKLIDILNNEEIPNILEQLLKTEIPTGSFSRMAIKNSKENRWVSLNDLASAFKIDAPQEIFGKLEPNFTLAVFSQKEGKRIALVAKTTDSPGLTSLLKNWENSAPFKPQTAFFKTAHYQGRPFRYLTLGQNDFGIVYLVLDNYLVLTSSYESMKNIADELIPIKK